MEIDQHIIRLLGKYLKDELHEAEEQELQEWADLRPENAALLARIDNESSLMLDLRTYWTLWSGREGDGRRLRILSESYRMAGLRSPHHQAKIRFWPRGWVRYAVALAIFIIAALGIYHLSNQNHTKNSLYAHDVPPGGNRAMLTLTDGRTILLDESQEGIVLVDDQILYGGGDTVAGIFNWQSDPSITEMQEDTWLSLATPKGGTYQVTLPDGTRVWLNAASTLHYPVRFDHAERVVRLEGEAYFEVKSLTRETRIPFFVKTDRQIVEVLGTHFVITAYPDEATVKTTLVEGSVQVRASENVPIVKLLPGEQSVLDHIGLAKRTVDVQAAMAWKNGMFQFESESIETIMRQLARWYDIEVVFGATRPHDTFHATISREQSLSEVLRLLEITDKVHFEIKGRRVTVMD